MSDFLAQIETLVKQLLPEDDSIFLVDLRIKPTNNIKVFVDTDEGITIETCIKLNRKLYTAVEESGMYPDGDFSLEVSSPGVGEPIRLRRQYSKNTGRWLEVALKEGAVLEGKLLSSNDTEISLEISTGKGKKQVIQIQAVPFEQIAKATVLVKF